MTDLVHRVVDAGFWLFYFAEKRSEKFGKSGMGFANRIEVMYTWTTARTTESENEMMQQPRQVTWVPVTELRVGDEIGGGFPLTAIRYTAKRVYYTYDRSSVGLDEIELHQGIDTQMAVFNREVK